MFYRWLSVHAYYDLNRKCQIWLYLSIRPVVTGFQSSSCVIWHSSAFPSSFPSLGMTAVNSAETIPD